MKLFICYKNAVTIKFDPIRESWFNHPQCTTNIFLANDFFFVQFNLKFKRTDFALSVCFRFGCRAKSEQQNYLLRKVNLLTIVNSIWINHLTFLLNRNWININSKWELNRRINFFSFESIVKRIRSTLIVFITFFYIAVSQDWRRMHRLNVEAQALAHIHVVALMVSWIAVKKVSSTFLPSCQKTPPNCKPYS